MWCVGQKKSNDNGWEDTRKNNNICPNNFRLHVSVNIKWSMTINHHSNVRIFIKCQTPTKDVFDLNWLKRSEKKTLKHFITVFSWRKPVSKRSHAVIALYVIYFFPISTKSILFYFFRFAADFWVVSLATMSCWKTIMTDLSMTTGIEKLFILLVSSFRKK